MDLDVLSPMTLNSYYYMYVVYWKYEAATSFLGAFAKLRKATINFVMCPSVRPSVRPSAWNNSAPTGRIFMEFEYFLKICCWENSNFIKNWQE
jgi:hypothetical protein